MNSDLKTMRCIGCEGGQPALNAAQAQSYLQQIPSWALSPQANSIVRKFTFKGFTKTMAFVNAIAWIVQQENHHPELKITFNSCEVLFTTHAVSGLTENDFICAAKIDALIA